MLSVVVFALSMAVLAAAAPAATATQKLGIRFEDSEGELPILSLPYATYKATSYEVADDVRLSVQLPSSLKPRSLKLLTSSRSTTSVTFVLRLRQLETFGLQSLHLPKKLPVFRMEVMDHLVLRRYHSHCSTQAVSRNHLLALCSTRLKKG